MVKAFFFFFLSAVSHLLLYIVRTHYGRHVRTERKTRNVPSVNNGTPRSSFQETRLEQCENKYYQ